jgi:hypothetical protein
VARIRDPLLEWPHTGPCVALRAWVVVCVAGVGLPLGTFGSPPQYSFVPVDSQSGVRFHVISDNGLYIAGTAGRAAVWERVGSGWQRTADFRRPPHRLPTFRRDLSACWIGFYVDGHCQVNGLNR